MSSLLSLLTIVLMSFATNLRFSSAGLRDGGPARALCADKDEALAVDGGALEVLEDVRAALTYF